MGKSLTAFERRMEIFLILTNGKTFSLREMSKKFNVNYATIYRDITALSRYIPISSKMGRYGGVYVLKEEKGRRNYLTRKEEKFLLKLQQQLSGDDYDMMKIIIHKFSMPTDENKT